MCSPFLKGVMPTTYLQSWPASLSAEYILYKTGKNKHEDSAAFHLKRNEADEQFLLLKYSLTIVTFNLPLSSSAAVASY
jgi:hypothetical protein